MSLCVYDNPKTMQRECWKNEQLLFAYACEFFVEGAGVFETPHMPADKVFFGSNIGPWKSGLIVGDPKALGQS